MKRKISDPFEYQWVFGDENGRLRLINNQDRITAVFSQIKNGDLGVLRSLCWAELLAFFYGYGRFDCKSSIVCYILLVDDESVRQEMLRYVFERLSLADPKSPYDVHINDLMSVRGILDNYDFLVSLGFDFAHYPRVFWSLNLYKLHERWTISFRLLNALKKLIDKGIEPHYAAICYPPLQNYLLKHRFFTRIHRHLRPMRIPVYVTRMICRMADYGGPFGRELTGLFKTDCRHNETASLSFDRLDLGVNNRVSMELDAIHPSLHDRFNAWSEKVALHEKPDEVKIKVLKQFAKMDRYLSADSLEWQFSRAIEVAEMKLKSKK